MKPILPTTADEFKQSWPKFSAWLVTRGSAIIATTNEYEVARYLTDKGTGIVYANAAGKITTWANGADLAFIAFRTGADWHAVKKTKRKQTKAQRDFRILAERDGASCIYCGCGLCVDTATVEHIVPLSAGGPNHLSNKALACKPCNQAVGSLPAAQKIAHAIGWRLGGVNA